jgi:hypothetical protein
LHDNGTFMNYLRIIPIALLMLFISAATVPAGEINATYLYNLSDFDGTIPYNAARTFVDEPHSEIYAYSSGGVEIYNATGMQVFHFDYDRELGGVFDAAVDDNGDILLLTYKDGAYRIVKCNYRGEPRSFVELKNLPPDFEGFRTNRMVYHGGRLYLANQSEMRVVVTDAEASFIIGYDLAIMFNFNDQQRMDSGVDGFTVDNNGNMLFTIPALGKAYRCALDGTIIEFGKRGSGPGKFGVPAGIAADKAGNLLVTDKLRGVVIIFDKDLKFVNEFGFRGLRPGNLIVPNEITIDTSTNRVYVSQMRRRGVNIYQLSYGE